MSKPIRGSALNDTSLQKISHVSIKSYLAQANNHANFLQSFNLRGQVRGAVTYLLWSWFVARWSTADNRSYPGMAKLQAIVARGACRLTGETQLMQNGIHEVA